MDASRITLVSGLRELGKILSWAMSSNPWFGHLLSNILKHSQSSQKGSYGPCLNDDISDLALIKQESGKNLFINIFPHHSNYLSFGLDGILSIFFLFQLMRNGINVELFQPMRNGINVGALILCPYL